MLNHPLYNSIDNNPDSPTFGAVQGKSGGRTMQLASPHFFERRGRARGTRFWCVHLARDRLGLGNELAIAVRVDRHA